VLNALLPVFEPCPHVREWAFSQFIEEGSPLQNPDHDHLKDAVIGFLWTNSEAKVKGVRPDAYAETGRSSGRGPSKHREEQLFREWFGDTTDFIITLYAPFFAEADEMSVCAVVEHELYHCGQEKDEFGHPKFTENGWPKWAMRPHDVEEFIGVAGRYGAYSEGLIAMQTVLSRPPLIKREEATRAVCGCGARV